jgi:ABC-2 type transport system ATP-binding protein
MVGTTTSPGDVLLEARGLEKRYGATTALAGVDLTIRAGQVYGLLGPNGAGKTTLIRAALGLVRPTGGEVRTLGLPPGHPAALRRLGAMVESPAFVPGLSGRVNLEVLARAKGVRRTGVDDVLEAVGLTEAADRAVSGYSMGMKQRLGVAAARLTDDLRLLILDEPTNGLDPDGVLEMRELIREVAATGVTLLISSHLLAEVEHVADRVVVLDRGRVVVDDTLAVLTGGDGGESVEVVVGDGCDVEHAMAGTSWRPRHLPGAAVGSAWMFDLDGRDLRSLLRALDEAGVEVVDVVRSKRSLEDAFLSLIADARQGV